MDIRKIMVVGAGFMGSGIAQVAIQAGYDVVLHDTTEELARRGATTVCQNLDRQFKKGKINENEKSALIARLSVSGKIEDAAGIEFVIEAAFEDFAVKRGIFEKLDAVCRPEVIFATNTPSLSITRMSSGDQI